MIWLESSKQAVSSRHYSLLFFSFFCWVLLEIQVKKSLSSIHFIRYIPMNRSWKCSSGYEKQQYVLANQSPLSPEPPPRTQ